MANRLNTDERDYSLSFVRLIAMIMIVLCHISQEFGNWTAQLLNVGVQIFLVLSGYLHSYRHGNTIDFLRRKSKRLLTNYYVFLVPVIILFAITQKPAFTITNAIELLTLSGTIHEVGHLWYVGTAMICFLCTPLFWDIIENLMMDANTKRFTLKFIMCNVIIYVLFQMIFHGAIKPAWISCYFAGMLLRRINITDITKYIHIALTAVYLLIRGGYASGFVSVSGWKEKILFQYFNYGHVLLGICIFYLIRMMYRFFERHRTIKYVLRLSDIYSYDIYLTHHVLILGVWSVFKWIDNSALATIVFLILVSIYSYIVNGVSTIILKRI